MGDSLPGVSGDTGKSDLPKNPQVYRAPHGRSYTALYHGDIGQNMMMRDPVPGIDLRHLIGCSFLVSAPWLRNFS